jgi:hypothetical protein
MPLRHSWLKMPVGQMIFGPKDVSPKKKEGCQQKTVKHSLFDQETNPIKLFTVVISVAPL